MGSLQANAAVFQFILVRPISSSSTTVQGLFPWCSTTSSGCGTRAPAYVLRNGTYPTEYSRRSLSLLAHPDLRVANSEILNAYSAFRAGRFEDAITSCASSFESVLKTICDKKGWSYDVNKDGCSKLVEICHTKHISRILDDMAAIDGSSKG